jgi:hypothetical protein
MFPPPNKPVPPPPEWFGDHPQSNWIQPRDVPWYRRWSRGRRLALVVVLTTAAYGLLFGPSDYLALKVWRAHQWLAEMDQATTPELRREALSQAVALAPDDEAVIRAMLHFWEATNEPVALHASRQIERRGWERPADVTRRVRLALSADDLDASITALLTDWSKEDPAKLDAERLVIASLWWARQGKTAEAVQRLATRLEQEPAGKSRNALQLRLAHFYLQESSTLGPQPSLVPAWSLLARYLGDERVSEASWEEASSLFATSLRNPLRYPALKPTDAAAFIGILGTASELPNLPRRVKLEIDLTRTSLSRFYFPPSGADEARALCSRWRDAAPELRLEVLRWLSQEKEFATALDWEKSARPDPLPQGWLTAQLDAVAGRGAWDQVALLLEAGPADALSPLLRQLFSYRAAKELAGPQPSSPQGPLPAVRKDLLLAAPSADPSEVLYAAEKLEAAGDHEAALQFFRVIKDREWVAGPARRGVARCLVADSERVNELIRALESVVTHEPRSNEAQGDLVYWRLMEGRAEPADIKKAQELAEKFPQYLSYRTLAALAFLKQDRPADALMAYDGVTVDWGTVPVSWRLVRAAVLAANDRKEQASSLVANLDLAQLKPGERLLFNQAR